MNSLITTTRLCIELTFVHSYYIVQCWE